jgi:DNA-binding CsgD family transcriptional regulator
MTDLEPSPQPNGQCQDGRPPAAGLTELEERIFDGLVIGKARREICRELGMGRTLYYLHVHAVRRYFRVRTTVEAVVAYVRYKAAHEDSPTLQP